MNATRHYYGCFFLAVLVAIAFVVLSPRSIAQASGPACTAPDSCSEIQLLLDSDGVAGEHLGASVSLENDRMVIGAPEAIQHGDVGSGVVYSFRLTGGQWQLEQVVRPLVTSPSGSFGLSVNQSGDVLVVGAGGYAYTFDRVGDAWVQNARLNPDAATYFGSAVAVDGDWAAISAPNERCLNGPFNCGAVYMFRRVAGQWLLETELREVTQSAGASFGASVALDADRMVVGAPNGGDFCSYCGAVHVFHFDGSQWQLEQVLGDSVPVQNSDFGDEVALQGTMLIAAAPKDVIGEFSYCGSVSAFSYDGLQWQLSEEFVPTKPAAYSRFGENIAFQAGQLAVSSDAGKEGCLRLNTVHRFLLDEGQWTPAGTGRYEPAPPNQSSVSSIAISGSQVMVGDRWASCAGGQSCGQVQVISYGADFEDCDCDGTANICEPLGCAFDCNANSQPDSCDIVSGPSPDCNGDGVPDECDPGIEDCNDNGEFDLCDIELGFSEDCNLSQTPDECDIASGYSEDADTNGIPDECPVDIPSPVTALSPGTSRFISFSVPPAIPPQTVETALRVDFIWTHWVVPPYTAAPTIRFTVLEGQYRWVGPPAEYPESASSALTFHASQLQCEPFYHDWSTIELLYVTGAELVPSSRFDVVNVSRACIGRESTCGVVSDPVDVRTTRWGDVTSPYAPPSAVVEPDIIDISVLVNKFKNAPSAPSKPIVMLAGDEHGVLNLVRELDFTDISLVVDAYRGYPYPYKPGICSVEGEPCLVDTDCCCGAVCTYCP